MSLLGDEVKLKDIASFWVIYIKYFLDVGSLRKSEVSFWKSNDTSQ